VGKDVVDAVIESFFGLLLEGLFSTGFVEDSGAFCAFARSSFARLYCCLLISKSGSLTYSSRETVSEVGA